MGQKPYYMVLGGGMEEADRFGITNRLEVRLPARLTELRQLGGVVG